jgi:hypothetical protein
MSTEYVKTIPYKGTGISVWLDAQGLIFRAGIREFRTITQAMVAIDTGRADR